MHDAGVPCREGPFTQVETGCINDAIHEYQEVSSIP